MDLYERFANDMVKKIAKTNTDKSIVSVYLSGSFSRGEQVVGITCIDIYVILTYKNDELERRLEAVIHSTAKKYLSKLLSWFPEGVNVSFTYLDDIVKGNSWLGKGSEYYTFKDTGKLLLGQDIKSILIEPEKEEITDISNQKIYEKKLAFEEDVPHKVSSKPFLKRTFTLIFSVVHYKLCYEEIYTREKEKLATLFAKYHPDLAGYMNKIYEYWKLFCQRELSEEEAADFIDNVRSLLGKV